MPKTIIRVVEDDPSVRNGLEYLLMSEGYESELYESAEAFLAGDAASVPGCIILDIRMPGMSGLELQNILIERKYPHPIIFLSGHGDIDIAVGAVKKGALDFLQKPVNANKFLEIVQEALKLDQLRTGNLYNPQDLLLLAEKLTDREKQIIGLIFQDISNKNIAERLNLSPRTVENHRAAAYRKLGVNSAEQLKDKFFLIKEELEAAVNS